MLHHGRAGYRRVSTFISFFLYKNLVLFPQGFVWLALSNFSGAASGASWMGTAFGSIWTAIPVSKKLSSYKIGLLLLLRASVCSGTSTDLHVIY